MREISLNILDITQNSVEAEATKIIIEICENIDENILVVEVSDNGRGIEEKDITRVMDPFYTSRKTRKVGMGLSIFQSMCERCGGDVKITSTKGVGTRVRGTLEYNNFDRPPIGRIEDTISGLLMNPGVDVQYIHKAYNNTFVFDSQEIREIIGFDINSEIIEWIRDFIRENLKNIGANPWS